MTIYYFEEPNGEYVSVDGSRRFIRHIGRQAYEYIKTHHYKKIRFFEYENDSGDTVKIELPPEYVKKYRKQERHEQYIDDIAVEYGGTDILSLDIALPGSDGDMTLIDTIADEDTDVVQEVLHQMDLQTLQRALHSLQPEETEILYALYLCDNPMSERKYADLTDVPQKTLNDRKKAILEKLKKFF